MYYVGELLARRKGYEAVVTGESIGQVSSQTLRNIRVIEEELPSELRLPILRPLSFYDKEEIISCIRSIGLYEETSKVSEACRISTGPVATRANPKVFREELSKVDLDLVRTITNTYVVVDVDEESEEGFIRLINDLAANVEIEEIPENNYVLVDVRSYEEYRKWHPKGAIHISELLEKAIGLESNVKYILYCDRGALSIAYAKYLRRLGINAYSLKGGITKLKRC